MRQFMVFYQVYSEYLAHQWPGKDAIGSGLTKVLDNYIRFGRCS